MVFAKTEDHKETDTCCHAHTCLLPRPHLPVRHGPIIALPPPVKKTDNGGRGVAFGVPAPAPVERRKYFHRDNARIDATPGDQ